MRFKVQPEDFRVEERLAVSPAGRGPYALFRVVKRNRTTLEVQTELAGKLALPPSAVQFPALKDKVAVAVQHATVRAGPAPLPTRIAGRGWTAELLGFLPRPLNPKDLASNRFIVTLRDLAPEEAEAVRVRFQVLAQDGFPNYFDLQRFGSWSARLGFPGKLLLLGRWEEALRAYLAEPLLGDPPAVLRFKKIAREQWGDWPALKAAAPKGNLRSVLTFLCDHPQDFKRAVNLITPRVLSLWLSAYQSYLWNKVASRILAELGERQKELENLSFPWGGVNVPRYPLAAEFLAKLRSLEIPLPVAKSLLRLEEGLIKQAFSAVLAKEGLELQDLKARGLERAYLPQGMRALWVFPGEPELGEPEPDELFPGQKKLSLAFSLPPGTYATLLLRLLSVCPVE